MQKIGFKISSERASALPSRKVPLRYIIEYLLDGETPGRVLTDYAIKSFCKALEVNDTIYEIGGAGSYYKRFFSESQEYIVTNIDEYHTDMIVDATSMPFETGSISAMASHFALEHIFDYKAVIDEVQRSLKPGGRFLLSVPFLYHYHAAPDDFFRFTSSALDQIFSDFRILNSTSFGNKWLLIAQLLHEKRVLGSKNFFFVRFALRILGLPFLIFGLLVNQQEKEYAITQLWLVEKV